MTGSHHSSSKLRGHLVHIQHCRTLQEMKLSDFLVPKYLNFAERQAEAALTAFQNFWSHNILSSRM